MNSSINYFFALCFFTFLGCTAQKNDTLDKEITTIENSLVREYVVNAERPQLFSVQERMEFHKVPGLSIAVVRNGKIHWAKGYGMANTDKGTPVDANTIFQAGSISKPVAALAALRLFEDGKLDLDTDINNYLTTWKIEENKFTKVEKVTLRRLPTHTAGATGHGFPGYKPTETFPTNQQVLSGEGNTPKVQVDTIPGALWRYSGGGYTIMETAVEDISGRPFEEYLAQKVLKPLGMENSTFQQPLATKFHAKASAAYDREGKLIDGLWHNYPEQAAAGLWTTPTDLAKYCMGIQNIMTGKSNGVLDKKTVEMMLTKNKNEWGLGPSLTGEADSLIFQHGGKNAGFTNNLYAFAHTGDAVVIMTNADNGKKLSDEVLRSISKYYDLGLIRPKFMEIENLTDQKLNKLAGRYKFERPDREMIVNVTVQNGKLIFNGSKIPRPMEMVPLNQFEFFDLEDGNKIVFQIDANSIGFLFNDRLQFYRVNE